MIICQNRVQYLLQYTCGRKTTITDDDKETYLKKNYRALLRLEDAFKDGFLYGNSMDYSRVKKLSG